MGKFHFQPTRISDLYLIRPTVFEDARGHFMETFNQAEWQQAGLHHDFVQDNESRSTKGVLRGLHFQREHPQGKLVRVLSGKVLDVAVDLRKLSPTFGQWEAVLLSSENKLQFFIPEGFAHGFLVLEDETVFSYKCTDYYHPQSEGGIRYNDPSLSIPWQDYLDGELILSAKDKLLPTFTEFQKNNPF